MEKNQKPLFETSHFGNRLSIYPDRVVHKKFFGGGGITVPLEYISDVYPGIDRNYVAILTKDGKRHEISVKRGDRRKVKDAILEAQSQAGLFKRKPA